MRRFTNILTETAVASADIKAYDLVGYDDTPINVADALVQGFALSPAKAGEAVSIVVIGSCEEIASGAITKGDKLVTAVGGKVKKAPTNAVNVFAHALGNAQTGEYVRYLKS